MELTIEQALLKALEAHQAGKLQDAERLYRAILHAQPKHPDANHNLGVLAVSVNMSQAALPLFQTALEANPSQGQFWLSYIDALIKEKQFDNARKLLEQGKKSGLAGVKVAALEEKLAQPDVSLQVIESKSNRLAMAIEMREEGKYQQAQAWINNFLDTEPSDAEGWSLLSQVYLLDKREMDAEKALSKAISINLNLPSVHRNQARLLLIKSKPTEALVKAKIAYDRSNEDLESWLVLAACLVANQKDQEALSLLERILKAKPKYAEAYVNRAIVQLRAKHITSAIADLEIALSLKPHLVQLWGLLGSLRYQVNNLLGAIEALKRAHALEPTNVNYMVDLGEFFKQNKQLVEAIALLEESTKLAPENAITWTNLGIVLQQDGKIDCAKIAYEKALVINPKSAEISNNLGAIAQQEGDWESALQYFGKSITLKPDLAEAHSNLGMVLKELGRLEDAEASYNKAISIKPEYAEHHLTLGNFLLKLGRLEDAEKSYRKAISIKPEYAEAYSNLGNTLRELGKLEDAEINCRKSCEIKPDLAEAHYNLANTLKELGRTDQAINSYRNTLALKPDLAEALYSLGLIYAEARKYEEAAALFKLINFKNSQGYLLRCLYFLNEQSLFQEKLNYLIQQGEISPMIGSLTHHAEIRYGIVQPNLFCNDPLKYVFTSNLTEQYDFSNIFVKSAKTILSGNRIQTRIQGQLINGRQTAGNLFTLESDLTSEIKSIIHSEIKKYLSYFKGSCEGLIKNWPIDYSLYGWLICMKSGGELRPHMHETGWISGTVYINVPPKSNVDSGNLVVCLGHEAYHSEGNKNCKKSIDVTTGSLCLFPASLLHYTIPFESEEERIVLAFDVVPSNR